MADYDPIAENHTNKVIAELEARDDGDPLVNKALAAALHFMQKQATRMDEMDRKLWTIGELEKLIDQRHNNACANCSAKKFIEEQRKPKQATLLQLLLNPAFVVSVIALVAVFMMLRMLGGQVAYKDVTGTAGQIMTGGMVK